MNVAYASLLSSRRRPRIERGRELGVQKLVDAVAGALGEVDDSGPLDDFIDAVAKRLRAAEPKEQ